MKTNIYKKLGMTILKTKPIRNKRRRKYEKERFKKNYFIIF